MKQHKIDVTDYRGKKVVLTYKKWRQKQKVHPELKNATFLRNLEQTICNPQEVWQDKSDRVRKVCYYKKYSTISYIKAVIWIASNPCLIISAFETNKIKEILYPELKRLK